MRSSAWSSRAPCWAPDPWPPGATIALALSLPRRRGVEVWGTVGVIPEIVERERVVIRIAGDSGDGMQLAGGRFTDATAAFGNDLATAPDYPAEVRAPAGTLHGVSAFQIHFASRDI